MGINQIRKSAHPIEMRRGTESCLSMHYFIPLIRIYNLPFSRETWGGETDDSCLPGSGNVQYMLALVGKSLTARGGGGFWMIRPALTSKTRRKRIHLMPIPAVDKLHEPYACMSRSLWFEFLAKRRPSTVFILLGQWSPAARKASNPPRRVCC